ncbi:LicD family protein [Nocardia brevicatena]|uniref:LicD family protein n=1 Tax=Nocardia brevicatena TaxID=37327 RepID=UPI000594D86C|nr:LicD family protein [Nocardia brevicatena]
MVPPRTKQEIVDRLYTATEITDVLFTDLGIRYTMIGGTLLGSLRHGGLIPWDDDVDLAIPTDDLATLTGPGASLLAQQGYGLADSGCFLKIFALDSPVETSDDPLDTAEFRYPFVHIFPMTLVDDRLVYHEPARSRWPSDYFEPSEFDRLHRCRFGPLRLSCVPDTAARRYLDNLYGPDWPNQVRVHEPHGRDGHTATDIRSDLFEPALPRVEEDR